MTTARWLTLASFVAVMSLILAALFAVFGNLRFDSNHYRAEFSDVSGLQADQFVRVAGVEVGKVTSVQITDRQSVLVDFVIDDSYLPTTATTATVRYLNLTGDRYLELRDGAGSPQPLSAGGTIALDHTAPALDLDALLGSFRPLLAAIEPGQINNFTADLLAVLQGQGSTVESLLTRTASVTAALADRDKIIGDLIIDLNTVLGSLADREEQLGTALDATALLAGRLADDAATWGRALTSVNQTTASLGELLTDTRAPIADTLTQLKRTADQLNAGSETIESNLSRLPDTYQKLTRLGAYGNFFNYYLCTLRLKLTGADGEDVVLPLFGQTTGRCEPR
ncbi:Mce family protein [Gordonia hirsuta DSM 44140 = NBRC 16056]|uniref:Mce family protein n=1 Tax=Gordonia hirsuta DSM 44140 = NBRC 16056 TaxID=1121927 RepID=L7L8H2_9ACTN|nr:MCE family protein [Gordonia hirsuta]GAC56352.1 Mce family protein [Gordonia hirsuta DSM 44140 = NBRC 16056]